MKRIALSLFVIFIITALVGCSPKGDPKKTLEAYYTNIVNANYDAAYELLSEADKKATSKDDFVLYMTLNAELYKLNEAIVTQAEKSSNTIVFDVSEKRHNYMEDKESSISYQRSVVPENGEWKVFADKKYGEQIAGLQNKIAWLHLEGRGGKKKSENEAASWFNQALERDPSYYLANYGLSIAYVQLSRFDDAITAANKFVGAAKEKDEQSNGYNVIGLCYESKGDREKAREAYQKSVELDPKNEYAKTNLNRVQ
ncbi:tetratricopeptide repeat protein [Brevibacillus borstelensis]|uniref:tetratricopeptide repeat protein n=1 Tax=Brevibacillus borstelensis TaxID=45462 RepID=UPI00046A2DBE|nr:tetratricopeptide repeat protein [Brevibacillus borstelensis]MCC0566535.1 tetratricopeptide repeat protein [Brevibacillus borstelensis]MCM3473069.1 tetratricopeptide repeat protein [Brevibacillus borstelensis]MCM3561784.1 tetratricopeptide repeat protein [Brevibacillus borstelensis]MED1852997.1 tetratricopeptide repeat protein [Brevibacillus borstelensis]